MKLHCPFPLQVSAVTDQPGAQDAPPTSGDLDDDEGGGLVSIYLWCNVVLKSQNNFLFWSCYYYFFSKIEIYSLLIVLVLECFYSGNTHAKVGSHWHCNKVCAKLLHAILIIWYLYYLST